MSLYWEQVLFKLICLPSWTHLVLISFCCAFRLCHPFKSFPLSPSLLFQKDWNFNFSISPSNEYSGLISFRIDWFDLLAAQGTLQSLLQHHSLKVSILQCSACFMVQLSHPYMTTGKTIDKMALCHKVLFNTLCLS